MEPTSQKKLKSPALENINIKTSVTCNKVPDGLFDATTAKKHFSKFGRVQKIRLFPKRQMCIIEYDQPISAERAVLNAGAFDGFMFDVTRTKSRIRRHSKKDDPDWEPDSDVEEELNAMRGAPIYRKSRQKPMEVDLIMKPKLPKTAKLSPIKKNLHSARARKTLSSRPTTKPEPPPAPVTVSQTSLNTIEAATELHQLRSKISLTANEKWRTLDTRDRILRAWGGAGSRVAVGGATIGTCPDMCPEKELLHRLAEHQIMTLEAMPDSDGLMEPWRAVKQYSRSSADQEIPMCYELRPASVLMRTCAYLLHEIVDTNRQVSLADWFHFMWDRLRGIRKDITQQALCCADSIHLVEMCARFHAHCAARLADLEHTQFDQKLNTDNLTKCLQTLKHMYADVDPSLKPREAEFRGYIALLNLGDANFWWEIKQLPREIQKCESIMFAIQIFTALDNNNYVRFFRLVKEKATYLQACILLRYFNDVRARALARIVKAYAPRGGSRYPAEDLLNVLAFESVESMKYFVSHYGLRFAKSDTELTIILDRNQFIEESDPFPIARAMKVIESKRKTTVGEIIAGAAFPTYDYENQSLYTSFNKDGTLKESALVAEDLGYNTINDSNKDIKELKAVLQRFSTGKNTESIENFKNFSTNIFPEIKAKSPVLKKPLNKFVSSRRDEIEKKPYLFQPAIPVASAAILKTSPVNVNKSVFTFSKPQPQSTDANFANEYNPFKSSIKSGGDGLPQNGNIFVNKTIQNTDSFKVSSSLFKELKSNMFSKPAIGKSLFSLPETGPKSAIFKQEVNKKNIFADNNKEQKLDNHTIFNKNQKNVFRPDSIGNAGDNSLFSKSSNQHISQNLPNIFQSFAKPTNLEPSNSEKSEISQVPISSQNFLVNKNSNVSPSSLFKNACKQVDSKPEVFSIFQSKNKVPTVGENIFNSMKELNDVYEFNETHEHKWLEQRLKDEKVKEEEMKLQEKRKMEEQLRLKHEEAKRLEEIEKAEKNRQQEEMRIKEEERKKEHLRKQKLEEEKKAELKRKAEENERIFKENVEKDSQILLDELLKEVIFDILHEEMKEERESLNKLIKYSEDLSEEILNEQCYEICIALMKAETFRTQRLMKKWFYIWRKHFIRNKKRRSLLEETPVWLCDKTPQEEANNLRRSVETAALKYMNDIHRGYKFTGELKQLPQPEPCNIMEIIRLPFIKRMKQLHYPYDKCFFWKITLVSPGAEKWLYRKVNIENWIHGTFTDKDKYNSQDHLLYVGKQSWNHLMDFAISVSLINKDMQCDYNEAIEGTNGLLLYTIDFDTSLQKTIEDIINCKCPYQKIPIAIITSEMQDKSILTRLEENLTYLVDKKFISKFKLFIVQSSNIPDSLQACTRRALKFLAKNCPSNPPIEIDYLKSICERYLGNEIWIKMRFDNDTRIHVLVKDLEKLVDCYNTAVDKLTNVLSNDDVLNYPTFPMEFNELLSKSSPFPKPYEFISSSAKNSDSIYAIKRIMQSLKLQKPELQNQPSDNVSLQELIQSYCYQIGWFQNPEKIASKAVACLPNDFFKSSIPCDEFSKNFEQYDWLDILKVIVSEKINSMNICEMAIYEQAAMTDYRNLDWLYEIEEMKKIKHKTIEYEDDYVDEFINAKRRKIDAGSPIDYLMLEDKDITMVEECINAANEDISSYNDCIESVNHLEKQIEEEQKKSIEFENLLRSALLNV